MCHVTCVIFGVLNLTKEDIKGKKVIEIGSYDVNGSLRSYFESLEPQEYVGIDIEEGPCVDMICKAEEVLDKFGPGSFDVIISTELIEHVEDWQNVITNIKEICKEGGIILITTRSYGFPYHPSPTDFWRYEKEDLEEIFADFTILALEVDKEFPGVFIKAKKPKKFVAKDLSNYKLYNMITGTKKSKMSNNDFKNFHFIKINLREKSRLFLHKIIKLLNL
jgi:SAM-dependent methyltransferase